MKVVETKAKEAAETAVKETVKTLNEKADAAEKAAKEAKEESEKAIKELKEKQEATQKHADELDVKLQKAGQKPTEQKSFAENIKESLQANLEQLKAINESKSGSERFGFNIKAAGTMTIGGNYSGGTVGLTSWDSDFARIQRRKPFLRELITVRPVDNLYVAWAEQANPDGGAGQTAEGADKTQADFDIVERSKKVEKITSYIKVSKEALADIKFLQSEINTELVELLNLKLDADILGANGTTPAMKGILEYAPAFSAPSSLATSIPDANRFDVIRAAVTQIQIANFEANYVLLNPQDAAAMELTKDAEGRYLMPPFATIDGTRIAGLLVVVNNGVTAGDFLVGDFRKSNLGIREEINISIGYENDDFTKNLVTILGEVRAVHYIKSNHTTAFVKGTFSTAIAALQPA